LVDDGLPGRANALRQRILGQSQSTTKARQLLIIVVWHRHERGRTRPLRGEPPVVGGHEPFAGCPRGESHGPTKNRLHREVRLESSGPGCGLQRSDVYVEFLGQLVER
jgi:hypothetical protein